jgi:hypothetical protein
MGLETSLENNRDFTFFEKPAKETTYLFKEGCQLSIPCYSFEAFFDAPLVIKAFLYG